MNAEEIKDSLSRSKNAAKSFLVFSSFIYNSFVQSNARHSELANESFQKRQLQTD